MLDLTFGEQVKLVLSRKGMTIKELAEIIEKRTGKKMSRQNLTQRLGRDNFQEQDMRMIAEILECPFRLSILADDAAAEEVKGKENAVENAESDPSESVEKNTGNEKIAEIEKKDGEQDEPDKSDKPAVKAEKPSKPTKESVRRAKAKARKDRKAREAQRLADAIERVPSEMRIEPVEKEMTLGDYMDIHEELVRQETERLPKLQEEEQEAAEIKASEAAESDAEASAASVEAGVQEEPQDPADIVQGTGDISQDTEQEEPVPEEQTEPEEIPENEAQPEVDVEELLREMEELERERQLLERQVKEAKEAKEARAQEEQLHEEKKITGWRAMFQRKTKKERQEELQEEAKIVEQVILREPTMEELEDDYIEYDEPETEQEEELESPEGMEEQPVPEDFLEELMEEDEDAEDLTRGELNPYTGHEYETNSVRMHPKRIGYVQLYDRRDHGWTDMTEWAFLGYQERKKALLGKDYDPPIYLD